MILAVDYASPSGFESQRDRALLGLSTSTRRPVRFHGRVRRNVPLLRFTLRALGEAIWSDDTWAGEGEIGGRVLDPVITVHPDRLFFEAFSQDQSTYAMVIANPAMFDPEGAVVTGTTNVDFTAWLWGALNELRSSRETWVRIGSEGFEVRTAGAGGRFQEQVELPDDWVRGFLQVSAAMAMPGTRLTLRPVDLLAALRFLRYTKAKVSPRALRYEFSPGQDARLLLEPWEHVVPLRGATHSYAELRTVRTWGRRRLKLIEPLLPFATGVEVFLKGRGLPSFYAVHLPDLTFVLGLSGWTEQRWTEAGGFDLLSDTAAAAATDLEPVLHLLRDRYHASVADLAEALHQPAANVWRCCERLCRQGRAMFDVETRHFRHRELFEAPADEAALFPPDERAERARALLARDAVAFARCEPQETRKTRSFRTPDGPVTREVVYRDWRVTGTVDKDKTEIVVGDTGRVLFGTCTCAFFQEHLLGRGPCEHMIALFRASADGRKDLPTSHAVSPEALPGRKPPTAEAEPDEAEEPDTPDAPEAEPAAGADEEDFDDDASDDQHDAR